MVPVSFTPFFPVQAFAHPLLQMSALIFDDGSSPSHQSTLDARIALVVKVPAALHGMSLTRSARSSLPVIFIPAFTPPALNPDAAVTPPPIGFIENRDVDMILSLLM
jgi:hypothetical protein